MSRIILGWLGLGLAALVACNEYPIGHLTKQEYTPENIETECIPQFLDISSFAEAETRLREYVDEGGDEQAWVTDGVTWKDVGGIATKHSNQLDEEAIQEALSSGIMSTMYFYHQHSLMRFNGYFVSNVPSVSDLFSHIILNREARRYGKQLVSRVVEVYGTWEFVVEDTPSILPPNGDSLFEALMPTGEAVKDVPHRLLKTRIEHHQRDVKDQIPYLLRAYEQIGGVSMRFTPNEYGL